MRLVYDYQNYYCYSSTMSPARLVAPSRVGADFQSAILLFILLLVPLSSSALFSPFHSKEEESEGKEKSGAPPAMSNKYRLAPCVQRSAADWMRERQEPFVIPGIREYYYYAVFPTPPNQQKAKT